jgi:hypothetical protein
MMRSQTSTSVLGLVVDLLIGVTACDLVLGPRQQEACDRKITDRKIQPTLVLENFSVTNLLVIAFLK